MELGGVTLLARGVCKPGSSLNLALRGRLRPVAVTMTVRPVSSPLLPQEVAAGHRGWAFLVTDPSPQGPLMGTRDTPVAQEMPGALGCPCHPRNPGGHRTLGALTQICLSPP